MRQIHFTPSAWEQLNYWLVTDVKLLKRIFKLLEKCSRHPFKGTGKPEPLKGDFSGWWSRRIDDTHRLVYRVEDKSIMYPPHQLHLV